MRFLIVGYNLDYTEPIPRTVSKVLLGNFIQGICYHNNLRIYF